MVRISLRVDTIEVPPQDVITRDNVTVKVNAVIYFRVVEPRLAVTEVSNFLYASSQLAQTTLRSVLGEVELDDLLSKRDELNVRLQSILDEHTSAWGVKVTLVSVKQVDLPEQMIRAIGRQAEAERESAPRSSMPKASTRHRKSLPWPRRSFSNNRQPYSYAIYRRWSRSGGEEYDDRIPHADRHFELLGKFLASHTDEAGKSKS